MPTQKEIDRKKSLEAQQKEQESQNPISDITPDANDNANTPDESELNNTQDKNGEKGEVQMTEQAQKPKRIIAMDTLVPVINNTSGKLIYNSPINGISWIWEEYGSMYLMPVSEIMTMKASHARFFNEQWIRIEDKEVVEHLHLEKFFSTAMKEDELEGYFDLSTDEMEEVLKKSTLTTKSLIATQARILYEQGELTHIGKIRMLERNLDMLIAVD